MSQNVLQVILRNVILLKKAETPKHSDSFLGEILVGKELHFPLFYPFYKNTNAVKSTL